MQRIMIQLTNPHAAHLAQWICLEEWVFHFGFVIANSTNSWQSVVVAANNTGKGKPGTIDIANTMFVIETHFYDGKVFVSKNSIQARYI